MCTAMLNENTYRVVYENTCMSGKTLTEMLSKILSKIRVYSIIPTLATFSDIHAD